MRLLIISSDDLPVYLEPGMPAGYKAENLHGQISGIHNSNGLIVLQEKKAGGFLARFHFLKTLKNFFIRHIFPSSAYMQTLVAMGEDILYNIEGYGKLLLKKGQYILVPHSAGSVEAELRKDKEYRIFEAIYKLDDIKGYEKIFFSLRGLLFGKDGKWVPAAREAGEKTLDAIREILHYRYDEKFEDEYYPQNLRQLLFLIAMQAEAAEDERLHSDMDAAYSLKDNMLANLAKRPAISAIAKEFGTQPLRLRKVFYKIFSEYPASYIKRIRMEKAWNWVTKSSKPVKVIATELGFKKAQSFSTKFKDRYGLSPIDARAASQESTSEK